MKTLRVERLPEERIAVYPEQITGRSIHGVRIGVNQKFGGFSVQGTGVYAALLPRDALDQEQEVTAVGEELGPAVCLFLAGFVLLCYRCDGSAGSSPSGGS